MSDSWPGNVQTNDDGIEEIRVGGENSRMESSHSRGGRPARQTAVGTHAYPPATRLSTTGIVTCRLACTQKVRAPPLPSPTDNEISPPCVSLCPSSRDSPPSHTKPSEAVCAQEGYVEEREGYSGRSGVAVPARRIAGARTQRNTNTCTNIHSGAIGTARRVMSTSVSRTRVATDKRAPPTATLTPRQPAET